MSLKDQAGQYYSSPDGKPAGSGVYVTLHGPYGGIGAVMVGGIATPLKR